MNSAKKILNKKTGCLFLLFYVCISGMTQTLSWQSLSRELQAIQKQLVPDNRVAILEVEIRDTLHNVAVLSGKTDLPEGKEQIIQYLTDQKIRFADSLRLLPDPSLGDKTWALAKLSVSNMRIQPKDASELVSQVLMGTPMKVLDYVDKWYLVQTPDHYIGWMDTAGLQTVSRQELDQWKESDRYLYKEISGFVYDLPVKKAEILSDIILGDLIEAESTIKGFLKIRIPDGRIGYIRKADCISFERWTSSEPQVQPVLSEAKKMMGFPYLWGGASSKAMDCSGFVKLVYFIQGIILARDASQQARYGEPINFSDRNSLQAGDLLFFGKSPDRITHMGIYLSAGDFIHASGMVRINSIDPGKPGFIPSRKTIAARRIMNSHETEGIVRVKDHPWYNLPH